MAIRMKYEPIGAPIVAAYSTGVGRAKERQRDKATNIAMALDKRRHDTAMAFQKNEWDIAADTRRFGAMEGIENIRQKGYSDRARNRRAWEDKHRYRDMVTNLPSVPADAPPIIHKALQDKYSALMDMSRGSLDVNDPEQVDRFLDTYDQYMAEIGSLPQPTNAENLRKKRAWRTPDGEYHDEPVEGAVEWDAVDDRPVDQPPDPAAEQQAEQMEVYKEQEEAWKKRLDEQMEDFLPVLEEGATLTPKDKRKARKQAERYLNSIGEFMPVNPNAPQSGSSGAPEAPESRDTTWEIEYASGGPTHEILTEQTATPEQRAEDARYIEEARQQDVVVQEGAKAANYPTMAERARSQQFVEQHPDATQIVGENEQLVAKHGRDMSKWPKKARETFQKNIDAIRQMAG